MQQSDLINSAEAARILGVDRATFNRWAKRGLVPIAITGPGLTGMRFFRRADILELAARRQAA
jgi:predicted site-specific integrase-resolvase